MAGETGLTAATNARVDPATITDPNGMLLPHARTFSGLYNSVSRVYSYRYDEAIRRGLADALAMKADAYLQALIQERIMPLARWPWGIECDPDEDFLAPPGSPQAEQRDRCRKLLQACLKRTRDSAEMRRLLGLAMWGGRSGIQGVWKRESVAGRPGVVYEPWQHIDGDKVHFTFDGTPGIMVRPAQLPAEYDVRAFDGGGHLLVLDRPALRDRFVVHRYFLEDADFFEPDRAGRAHGSGYRDMVFWCWWLRGEMLSWLMNFMEKVGSLGILIFYYPEGNAAAKSQAEAAALNVDNKNALAVPVPAGKTVADARVELLPANVTGVQFLSDCIDKFFESKMERLIVGQSMSSGADHENGLGGTGRAALAKDTKFQLLSYDAERLDETLTHDWVGPAARLIWPNCPWRYRLKSKLPNPAADDLLGAVERACRLPGPNPMLFVRQDIYDAIGMAEPQPGQATVGGQMAQPGMPGQAGGAGEPAPGAARPGVTEAIAALMAKAAAGDSGAANAAARLKAGGFDKTDGPKTVGYEWAADNSQSGGPKADWVGPGGQHKPLYGAEAEKVLANQGKGKPGGAGEPAPGPDQQKPKTPDEMLAKPEAVTPDDLPTLEAHAKSLGAEECGRRRDQLMARPGFDHGLFSEAKQALAGGGVAALQTWLKTKQGAGDGRGNADAGGDGGDGGVGDGAGLGRQGVQGGATADQGGGVAEQPAGDGGGGAPVAGTGGPAGASGGSLRDRAGGKPADWVNRETAAKMRHRAAGTHEPPTDPMTFGDKSGDFNLGVTDLGFGAEPGTKFADDAVPVARPGVPDPKLDPRGRGDSVTDKPASSAGAPALAGPKPPAGPRKRSDLLSEEIARRGGLDPSDPALHAHYSGMREAVERGLPLRMFKTGGGRFDQLAESLHNEGYINTPEGVNPTQHLADLLEKKSRHDLADVTDTHAAAVEAHDRARQEAFDATATPEDAAAAHARMAAHYRKNYDPFAEEATDERPGPEGGSPEEVRGGEAGGGGVHPDAAGDAWEEPPLAAARDGTGGPADERDPLTATSKRTTPGFDLDDRGRGDGTPVLKHGVQVEPEQFGKELAAAHAGWQGDDQNASNVGESVYGLLHDHLQGMPEDQARRAWEAAGFGPGKGQGSFEENYRPAAEQPVRVTGEIHRDRPTVKAIKSIPGSVLHRNQADGSYHWTIPAGNAHLLPTHLGIEGQPSAGEPALPGRVTEPPVTSGNIAGNKPPLTSVPGVEEEPDGLPVPAGGEGTAGLTRTSHEAAYDTDAAGRDDLANLTPAQREMRRLAWSEAKAHPHRFTREQVLDRAEAARVPNAERMGVTDDHEDAVRKAVERGDEVPPEVLADYPDLQPAAPSAGEPAPADDAPRNPLNGPDKQLDIFGTAHAKPRPAPPAVKQSLIPAEVERQDDARRTEAALDAFRAGTQGEPEPAAPAEPARPGHEMTREEFGVPAKPTKPRKADAESLAEYRKAEAEHVAKSNDHYRAVNAAIKAGHKVPAKVLAAYPWVKPTTR